MTEQVEKIERIKEQIAARDQKIMDLKEKIDSRKALIEKTEEHRRKNMEEIKAILSKIETQSQHIQNLVKNVVRFDLTLQRFETHNKKATHYLNKLVGGSDVVVEEVENGEDGKVSSDNDS